MSIGLVRKSAKPASRALASSSGIAFAVIATGSEVSVTLDAGKALQGKGVRARVVSMPCWELFDAQDAAYRATVLPPGGVRVAVEAALRFGWDRYLGERGGFVGMTGFGASGPADALYEKFGITPAAIVSEAKRCLSERA